MESDGHENHIKIETVKIDKPVSPEYHENLVGRSCRQEDLVAPHLGPCLTWTERVDV